MIPKTRPSRLRNKWWRLTHLYKILDKDGRLVTFKPSRVQLMILAAIGSRLRARILKYRQGGVTTLFCIDYLDDALWTPGHGAAIIAHERETLDKIFEIVDRAFENLPENIKPKTERNTLRMFKFKETYDGQPLDSEIYVALKLRGGTVQALHITERAYIEGEKSQELEAGSKQAVPLTGRITEETTANGFNEYYDAFMEDYENPGPDPLMDTLALFFAWHEDPQYTLPGSGPYERTPFDENLSKLVYDHYGYHLTDGQLRWYNWKMRDLEKAARSSEDKVGLSGVQLMRQEYPSTVIEAFQSGLGNVFDSDILAGIKPAEPIREMRSEKVKGEKIRIFHEPEAGKNYYLGGDPSNGTAGGDPGAISVWDEDRRKCAEWSGNLRPDRQGELAMEMGYMYNTAFAGVENNMLTMVLHMNNEGYPNLFQTVRIDQKRQKKTTKLGWTTSGQSRDVMIDDYIALYEDGDLAGLSAKSLSEMKTFVRKEGGKREHASGKHDDMLFADMIAQQMINNKDKSKNRKRSFTAKPGGL